MKADRLFSISLSRRCMLLCFAAWLSLPLIADDKDAKQTGAKQALDSCHVYRVRSLPGSHLFGSEFIVAIGTDPDPAARTSNIVWALTADVSNRVPVHDRAMYISRSADNGESWTPVARIDSTYIDAKIGEGLRNGLGVSPGGAEFVITTQRGAFQIIPQSGQDDALINSIRGPRVPHPRTRLYLPKKENDPIRAGVVRIFPDGKHMIVGYGSYDLNPQIFIYRRDESGSWVEEKRLLHLPTKMDILSLQFADFQSPTPESVYVGTGDQAYHVSLQTMRWNRVAGVGDDSAIHSISTVGGPHFAACWGVYNPLSAEFVKRVTAARFLLHRFSDEVGPNIRAYGIEVDPLRPEREIVTAITGAYLSSDSGQTWKRINDLPDGEFRTAHFNPDGTAIISGVGGTFLANPFSNACSPHLTTRGN